MSATTTQGKLPHDQEAEMRRLKGYFPFRIVYCIASGDQFHVGAARTKHRINSALKKGEAVWTL